MVLQRQVSGSTKALFVYLTAIAVYVLDLLSKTWIRQNLAEFHEIPLLPYFRIYHNKNTGAAFSLFSGSTWVLTAIAIGVVLVIIAYERRHPTSPLLFAPAIGLILGGTLGNLHDRLARGYVTDFLDAYWGPYHWPTFNVADMSIVCGSFLLFLALAREANTAEDAP